MLTVRSLCVEYGPIVAVSDLDLEVGQGEAVAVLGTNGAGKSSTLRAISGLERYTGTVEFDGHDLARMSPDQISRLGLIHVPEGRRVFSQLSVVENLQLGRRAKAGRSGGFTIDEVFDLFPPLRALTARDGWALSGGEQQMVAIGRALVGAPRVLLLDEPSLGLAPVIVDLLYTALDEVRRRTPLLVIEQQTAVVLAHCDRAYVLAGGRRIMDGTSKDIVERADLLDRILGQADVHVAADPDRASPAQT